LLDTYALLQSQYWPRERIERYQDERLAELFKAARGIPFWDRMFAKAEDGELVRARQFLAKLPVTSKKDLSSEPLENVARKHLLRMSDHDHTSGSTGRPFQFYFDWHAGLRSFAVTERIFRTAGRGKRYGIVYMRWRERNGFTPYHEWFFLRGFHGVKHRLDEFRKLAARFPQGFMLYGYASSVLEVARQVEKEHIALPLRATLATGESVGEADRKYLERVTGVPFYSVYASREAGYLASECEERRLHLSEEWALVEIVDEHGIPLSSDKEGRVVVTVFDNITMPFIRYELGDRGTISEELCPCGRTSRTIRFRGRSAEMIETEGGRTVALLDVTSMIDRFWEAVRQFHIIQTGTLSFVIKVVPGPAFNVDKERLELLLIQLLHPEAQITWEKTEEIPEAKSGKAVYFTRDFQYK
jgi:phenylacetate-CoA ligase